MSAIPGSLNNFPEMWVALLKIFYKNFILAVEMYVKYEYMNTRLISIIIN